MRIYRLLTLLFAVTLLSSCALLDRKDDAVADLEQIPEQAPSADEPSILIDDEEMMAGQGVDIIEDSTVPRSDQIDADPSGTFVGQKIPDLVLDYDEFVKPDIISLDQSIDIKWAVDNFNKSTFGVFLLFLSFSKLI